jgi:hypothetical protein
LVFSVAAVVRSVRVAIDEPARREGVIRGATHTRNFYLWFGTQSRCTDHDGQCRCIAEATIALSDSLERGRRK